MATSEIVGSVAGLWRFPVKSMRGERIEQVELTGRGLVGDRAYALIDADTGKVVSAKSVRLFPD
ncbi:MAG TPA: MOSC N-terminal beta barrel domain-containing protein, partial [Pyrinomonadaceae bacterium]|nr:MOSC N-terminal beta barrel domain-containing protein [Pyrinomonadaceae bacterium]